MKRGLMSIIVAGIVLSVALSVQADTLKTKDGRVFEGKVILEDNQKVIFEVHRFGATARMTFRRSEIHRIIKGPIKIDPVKPDKSDDTGTIKIPPEPKAPKIVKYKQKTYYVIPFEGEVGTQVLASYLERSFEDALRRKPDVVLIVFDSPGGLVNEVGKLTAAIKKYNKRLRIVAYVRRALSAAAITSLACREIYFDSQAVLGAATAYKMSSFGLPEAISEKFQSVWRAQARSAAAIGGHDPLLAEAMIDAEVELYVVTDDDGKVRIEQGRDRSDRRESSRRDRNRDREEDRRERTRRDRRGVPEEERYEERRREETRRRPSSRTPSRRKRGRKLLIARGKLLTLTSDEAVDCGLADGVAETYDELGVEMKFKDWVECKGHATLLAEHWDKSLSTYMKRIRELGQDFNWNMRKAVENDPNTPRIPYRYSSNTGLYARESRRRWRNRSRKQSVWLLKAEKNVEQAILLVKNLEQLESVVENFEELIRHIKNARLDVQRNANRRGPDD